MEYLEKYHEEDCFWRIDLIDINLNRDMETKKINHIKWAVGEN